MEIEVDVDLVFATGLDGLVDVLQLALLQLQPIAVKGVNPYILLFWFRGHILAD